MCVRVYNFVFSVYVRLFLCVVCLFVFLCLCRNVCVRACMFVFCFCVMLFVFMSLCGFGSMI